MQISGIVSKVKRNREIHQKKFILDQYETLDVVGLALCTSPDRPKTRRLQHPNFIKYYKSFVQNRAKMILMEYAAGGMVFDYVEERAGMREP